MSFASKLCHICLHIFFLETCIVLTLTFDILMQLLTAISTIDDLNYPEKTETYYIVNAPYVFSACWKVVRPLLQERTRRKIQVLQGCGRAELLKIMDDSSLPHFCRKECSASSQHSGNRITDNCYSLDHVYHQEVYNYIKQQAALLESVSPMKQGSVHVDVPEPDPEDAKIAKTIECELHRLRNLNGLFDSLNGIKDNGNRKCD
uniref:SEC14 cytosolic factor n=1 Tax=Rhizophora mucronata TaxID=61149 RepID=A0A2P2KE70_RHIMU